MNESIENENSMIRVGDEIIVTVPEPELSVERKETLYYEACGPAPPSEIRSQPPAGNRFDIRRRYLRAPLYNLWHRFICDLFL